jgi:hypothetical protein
MIRDQSSRNIQSLKSKRSEAITSSTVVLILNRCLEKITFFTLADLDGKSLKIILDNDGNIHPEIDTFAETESSSLGLRYSETELQLKSGLHHFQVVVRNFVYKNEETIFRNGTKINFESEFINTSLFTFSKFHIYVTNNPENFLLTTPYLYMKSEDMLILLEESFTFLQPILSREVISYFDRCLREEKTFRWELNNLPSHDEITSRKYVERMISILNFHSKKFKIYLF